MIPQSSGRHTSEQLRQIIKQDEAIANREDALKRLMANPDFKEVILDGFIRDYATRQIRLASSDTSKSRDIAIEAALATGHLDGYFKSITQQAKAARSAINSNTMELDIRRERGEG